jgi:GxxExxY protein
MPLAEFHLGIGNPQLGEEAGVEYETDAGAKMIHNRLHELHKLDKYLNMEKTIITLTPELEAISYKVIGACMEVHSKLGPGFPEEYYQNALDYEFRLREISFETQKAVEVFYKDISVGLNYLDFLIDEKLILEIKSIKIITNIEIFQVIKYLAATGLDLALLVNFGKESLEYKRIFPPKKIQSFQNRQ